MLIDILKQACLSTGWFRMTVWYSVFNYMIDAHCHLQFKAFANDYDAVIQDAFDSGITEIITTATQLSSSISAIQLADKYEHIYAVIGVHPHHADKIATQPDIVEHGETPLEETQSMGSDWIQSLRNLCDHPKVIGIGEIGMDYYAYKSNGIVDPKRQREVFEAQLELAYQQKLPLQIHNRHAGKDLIKILKENKRFLLANPGMFHCFAGDYTLLKSALNMGFSIGFDGNATYSGLAPGETVALRDIIKATPLDRIVVETDAPYLTPIPHRGKRNEPKYSMITAQYIAEIKNVSINTLVEQTDKNVYTIFTKIKTL